MYCFHHCRDIIQRKRRQQHRSDNNKNYSLCSKRKGSFLVSLQLCSHNANIKSCACGKFSRIVVHNLCLVFASGSVVNASRGEVWTFTRNRRGLTPWRNVSRRVYSFVAIFPPSLTPNRDRFVPNRSHTFLFQFLRIEFVSSYAAFPSRYLL